MHNPIYLDTTPPRFWRALVRADGKLHRQPEGDRCLELPPKTDQLRWSYTEAPLEGNVGGHRITTWKGRRWLGPLSLEGRLHIARTLLGHDASEPTQDPETGSDLSWLGSSPAREDAYVKPALTEVDSQPADEIHAGYNFSLITDDYMLFVKRRSHTTVYTLPHKLPFLQQAAHDTELLSHGPNPMPDDCQLILDEMRIGAGDMYGYHPNLPV